MLNTKWQGQDFLFAMNGQTGKLVGDLPIDKKKYWTTLLLIGMLLSVLSSLVLGLTGDGRPLSHFLIAIGVSFLAGLLTCCILSAGMKNVHAGTEAGAYLSEQLTLTHKHDQYTHTTTTRTKIQKKETSKA